ncbi:MAG TPA: aminotransferase class V-fold PLP-dependent enzyme [Bryobacteraceae bacterium]|nr:aminotransferase class V-fold PLP-dependent enzyme [Bryobacteraceae bacterium]
MPNRRTFLQTLSGLPLIGGLMPATPLLAAAKRDYLKELGVRPIINAAGTFTMFTASLMPPEVVQAWEYGSRHYVRLNELHDAVGKRLAELIGCEAAMVSAGAASALTLGTAACVTGTNQDFIHRLPEATGMKTEVILQKTHRFGYDHAIRNCGIKLIEIETLEELERAVNDRTVMMFFLNLAEPAGQIKASEWAELGKKHGIPTFIDCAADVPPVENLSKFTKMGFSLVTFSGGKGLCGPQSAGLLLGRKDLIEAARLNASPYSDAIGRGMKVNKEELLAMLAAVERYVKMDHKAEWREWERRAKIVSDSIASIPTIQTETKIPEIANQVPHLHIRWDTNVVKISVLDVVKQLREGDPAIEPGPGSREDLIIGVWMMQKGDAQIVARRIRQILKSAQA